MFGQDFSSVPRIGLFRAPSWQCIDPHNYGNHKKSIYPLVILNWDFSNCQRTVHCSWSHLPYSDNGRPD